MTKSETGKARYLGAVSLLVLSLGIGGCTTESGETAGDATSSAQELRTVRVETLTLEPQPFEDVIALIGILQSPNDARLSAETVGRIISRKPLGSQLRAGESAARIDATVIEVALRQARANLDAARADADLAEDTFRRQEPLYADSIISALEYEQFRTQLSAARARLAGAESAVAQAEEELEKTYIRAPFAGTVEEHFAEVGEHVAPGMPVARVVDTQTLKIAAGVPERYAGDIRIGTAVSLHFKSYSAANREGTISFVGNVIDPQNRSFRIEITLDNSDGALKPAMVADVFVTRSVLTEQIVIPQTAVLRDENGRSVYVVDGAGSVPVADRKTITLGATYGGRTVVTSGLEFGDEVIVVGQNRVTEGDAIERTTEGPALSVNE